MRILLLLILMFCAIPLLKAQDTIRTLIISEARIDYQYGAYVELTNVGSSAIDLSKFEFGKVSPWTIPYKPNSGEWFMLPKKMLAPGRSFVMAKVNDYCTRMWVADPEHYDKYQSKPEFYKLADMQIHVAEATFFEPQSVDSVSSYASVMSVWNGSYCWYLRHHISTTDSIIVDQVGGVFDDSDGTIRDESHDVAGVPFATSNSVLIRKASVIKGNPDFNIGRGTNAEESEWIVVPFLQGSWEPFRAVFWTVGNQGNYQINSLISDVITINWVDSTLDVPWGIRNDDSIIYKFKRVPGIAWHYDYNGTSADSVYLSVQTGDKLTVYACGNKVEKIVFKIKAMPPAASDNKVIPKKIRNKNGFYRDAVAFCEVTDNIPVMDTISNIPYACRVDTLLKYLEKPANASWEFLWVGGIVRADLKTGDILKVTSENGLAKKYFIKANRYFPGHNTNLTAITWPDIPDNYRGIYGWKGDTIPNFSPTKYLYKLIVPYDYDDIPALVCKTASPNATVSVTRASKLKSNAEVEERTITFLVTAEDGVATKEYKVELVREWCCIPAQQWKGEPFISQYVFKLGYVDDFCEIFNPGTQQLDLSNYMITFGYYNNADEAITRVSGWADWSKRYNKYIPGYKWVNESTWASAPARVEQDVNINPIVNPHDVFVMANIVNKPNTTYYPTILIPRIDIDFNHNPWGDDLSQMGQTMQQWWGQKVMLFKILNDSIKQGLKPANDPKDFKLIDAMGVTSGDRWIVGGKLADQNTSLTRKKGMYKGNPVLQSSFGTTLENSEWIIADEHVMSYIPLTWPDLVNIIAGNIGSHESEITLYKSTISSKKFAVSTGFSIHETIRGIGTGVTVSEFYSNITKADTGQHLKVRKFSDGSLLSGNGILSSGDTLIVVSSDSVNTTKYIIDTTPLSNLAMLTSSKYLISVNGNTGEISNFEYGTDLKTVVEGVVIPVNASIVVVDAHGAYQPIRMLNFDTVYTYVKVNNQITFIVTAEDGITKIEYRLKPNSTNSDAFVTSDFYEVRNNPAYIGSVLGGTSVKSFYSNIYPTTGATMKLLDKFGLERKDGYVCSDDKLMVTAADGVATKTYYLINNACSMVIYLLTSKLYIIDNFKRIISGDISVGTPVDSLISKLVSVYCATIKLYDKSGSEKALTDKLAEGDQIVVTSCCGQTVLVYSISFVITNTQTGMDSQIKIYPNPSRGKIKLSGLEIGSNIMLYNVLGELIFEKNVFQSEEDLKLDNFPAGIYLIKVNINGKQGVCRKIIISN